MILRLPGRLPAPALEQRAILAASNQKLLATPCLVKIKKSRKLPSKPTQASEAAQTAAEAACAKLQRIPSPWWKPPALRLAWVLAVTQSADSGIPLQAFDSAITHAARVLGRKPNRVDLEALGGRLSEPLRVLASLLAGEVAQSDAAMRWRQTHEQLVILRNDPFWTARGRPSRCIKSRAMDSLSTESILNTEVGNDSGI